MIRILIVDDQNLVQQGIKSLLDRDLDLKVIGTVKDGRNAVQQIAQTHPDVVLLDIEMPGMNGITTTRHINRVSPKTKVIILSSHEERKYVTQALMAGAKGYLLKSSLMNDLKQAILAVNNGYSQIDSRLLAKVFDPQNLKAKKTKSTQKSESAAQKNLKVQNATENLAENKNTFSSEIDSSDMMSSTPSSASDQATSSQPMVIEGDTVIQSQQYEPLITPEIKVSAAKPHSFAQASISDYVILKKADSEININLSHPYQKNEQDQDHPILLAPIKENLTHKFRKKRVKSKLNLSIEQKAAWLTLYIHKLLDHPQRSIFRLNIDQLRSKLKLFTTKIRGWIRQKSQHQLLWNISLVILGILITVVLSKFI